MDVHEEVVFSTLLWGFIAVVLSLVLKPAVSRESGFYVGVCDIIRNKS